MTKSFFEYVGLADSERVHSQMLAWLLSADCGAFDDLAKIRILHALFGYNGVPENSESIIQILTEFHGIDILIITTKRRIVIENKFKSSQHSNQLERYKELCEAHFPGEPPEFFFLSLIREDPRDNDWCICTYSDLHAVLANMSIRLDCADGIIISEYLRFLERLKGVVSDFFMNYQKYPSVFLNGSKKKYEKAGLHFETENEQFIASLQLETILQKGHLLSTAKQMNGVAYRIGETRGDALIDFPIYDNIAFEGRMYGITLQLQNENLKLSFAIQSEPYQKSSKEWIKKLFPMMESIAQSGKFGYKQVNYPKKLAYIAVSKKMTTPYWFLAKSELASILTEEIKNCQELKADILNRITLAN